MTYCDVTIVQRGGVKVTHVAKYRLVSGTERDFTIGILTQLTVL